MISERDYPLALVAHDAGGANQIIYWLKYQAHIEPHLLRPVMEGPARVIWTRLFPNIALEPDLATAISGATCLIAGTGWASNLEFRAICMAKERGIRTIAYLDHWLSYRERFSREGIDIFPDELWCSDTYALELAKSLFPGCQIKLAGDFYMQDQLQLVSHELPANPTVLYLTEPRHDRWGKTQPAEFQALEFFLANLAMAGIPPRATIVIRPHPSESSEKYMTWMKVHLRNRSEMREHENNNEHQMPRLEIDAHTPLGEALRSAQWVVGCESHAMAVALEAGRTVICALPPWAPPCRLPHQHILRLAEILLPSSH